MATTRSAPPPVADPGAALEALVTAEAISSFASSGLLRLLDRFGPATTAELARRAHVDAGPLGLLFDVLASTGVVVDTEEGWLLNGTAEGWHVMLRGAGIDALIDRGQGATDVGDPTTRREVGTSYRDTVGILVNIVRPIADAWAPRLAARSASMLEIGAGAAPWTRAMLHAEPSMRATVLDLPEVVDASRDAITADVGEERVEFVAADVFAAVLAERFDVVVVSGFCRLFDEHDNRVLFERIAGWLAPHGRLVIGDAVDIPGSRARGLAVYELGLAARSSAGRAYTLDDFAGWLGTAGLAPPTVHPTDRGAYTLLLSSPDSAPRSSPDKPVPIDHHLKGGRP